MQSRLTRRPLTKWLRQFAASASLAEKTNNPAKNTAEMAVFKPVLWLMVSLLHKGKLSTASGEVDSGLYFEHGLVNQFDSADPVAAFVIGRLL